MSAVMTDTASPAISPPDRTELYFKASRDLRRDLVVLRSKYYLTVAAYQPTKKSTADPRRMLAYASIARDDDDIRLHIDRNGGCDLWLGSAAFGLTQREFTEIADKLGIRITRDEAQS